ncbi:SRPBCC family protein [Pedosphaera parvula]|uniref:Activator of Hsp90 ATPase 1 family protein n=1 Tax=Pedosphaera parvula (strain Ellin514) TaxID=320771 RepID=B9XQC1_PEDPL|nr:SRPBCC domain-containing protein [Pedosphaera parvula]EEF57945.1 Activator of Hsp90 ATPase 1 family protein [Pedosphaera parvula Ellin514]
MTERKSNPATETSDRVLLITRVFDAPPSLVFKVWTQPEYLVRWWGRKDFTLPSCEMDFRPGGAYRLCMRSPEGIDYWLSGVYREIVEPERIVFTWEREPAGDKPGNSSVVTVTFAEHDGKTKFALRQANFETTEERNEYQGGWTECLDSLSNYVSAKSVNQEAPK